MFQRTIADQILKAINSFYSIALVGPRQSGKTTLLKTLFPEYVYINLENPETLDLIKSDPKGFFNNDSKKWIIDEAQEYPELFSYLLIFIDKFKIKGQFILSGSKNFVILEKISQSLAGRVAILELLPLSFEELSSYGSYSDQNIWELIFKGGYPGTYYNNIDTNLWYKSYISTYIQRDVRQLINVKDLAKFYLFIKLCAGRHGQLINYSEVATSCGVSHVTIKQWINILELSYIVFQIQPYYKNFNKRLIKTPKLYFYDSGLVCNLLGIENSEHAKMHSARGALFEGYVISEILKQYAAKTKTPSIFFWNNHKGFEIDLLMEKMEQVNAIEIKSGSTFSKDYIKQLSKWQDLDSATKNSKCYVVYAGEESIKINNIDILSYKDLTKLF